MKKINQNARLCRNCFNCRVTRNMVFCGFDVWTSNSFKPSYVFDTSIKSKKNKRFGRCNYYSKVEGCALECQHYEDELEKGRRVWDETGMVWDRDKNKWRFNYQLKYKPNINKRYLKITNCDFKEEA